MKIEVLGSGCKRCSDLFDNVMAAVTAVDPPGGAQVVKVTDVNYFARKGVFMTPGLLIDGDVVATGKLLTIEEISSHLQSRIKEKS